MPRSGCECDSPIIEHDSANGIAFCTKCGTVLEENAIVAEVQFIEGGDGRHMALGSRVSANGRNSGYPYGRSSSDSSAMVARETILQYATALNCNVENVVEIANRIYTITHRQGLTKGRQVSRVCAVCLYIALRKERTPIMLIELADLLKVSVFKLGTLFMLIRRQFPDDADVLDIDPSIYIARFAAMLNLGTHTRDVMNDALKLVRRMKRDWLADGRRPAGICGACLFIAARMHNVPRSLHDIVNIVKMSGVTVKTRLKEFKKTTAANLSCNEFRLQFDWDAVDAPCPPSSSMSSSSSSTTTSSTKKRKRTSEWIDEEIVKENIDFVLKKTASLSSPSPSLSPSSSPSLCPTPPPSSLSSLRQTPTSITPSPPPPPPSLSSCSSPFPLQSPFSSPARSDVSCSTTLLPTSESSSAFFPTSSSSTLEPSTSSSSTLFSSSSFPTSFSCTKEDSSSLSDLDNDEDIANVLVTPEEASLRASIWYGLNQDYLLEQQQREARKSQMKARSLTYGSKRIKEPPPTSLAEAVQRLASKKISNKINQSMVHELFGGGSDPLCE